MGAGVTPENFILRPGTSFVLAHSLLRKQNGKCNPAPMLIMNQEKLPSISQTVLQFSR